MTTPKNTDPRQKTWELAKVLHESCGPAVFSHTVPIFRETEEKALNFGSGVLVRVEGKPFLLTAGHVLDEVVTSKDVIGLSTGETGTQGVQLLWEAYATNIPPGTARPHNDFLDVGAIRLRQDVAEALADRFASEDLVETRDNELQGNLYLVLGFPGSSKKRKWFKGTAQANSFSYATSLYRLARGTPRGYDPEVEVLVDYSKGNNLSPSFHKVMASDPYGMSGCGIWKLFSSEPRRETWDATTVRLVGLTHTYSRTLAIIRGTRIGIVLEMVREKLL